MTAKAKAKDLVDNFRIILINEDTDCGNEILCTMIAIECAKVCVSEILNHAPTFFYEQVFIEIDLL
jgi:hypothetical protein